MSSGTPPGGKPPGPPSWPPQPQPPSQAPTWPPQPAGGAAPPRPPQPQAAPPWPTAGQAPAPGAPLPGAPQPGAPAPGPAAPGQTGAPKGPKPKEIKIIPADTTPPDPKKKIFAAVAILVAVWLVGGFLGMVKRSGYQDGLSQLVPEAHGNNAQQLAEKAVDLAKVKGLPVKLSGVTVRIGEDGALGRQVSIAVRYRPMLGFPKTVRVERKSGNTPLRPSEYDGATGQFRVLEGI